MPLDKSYTIFFEKKFQKALDELPEDIRSVFKAKMDYFRSNPKHPSLNTKPYAVSPKRLKQLGVESYADKK